MRMDRVCQIVLLGSLIVGASGCAQGVGHTHSVFHKNKVPNNQKLFVRDVCDSSYNDTGIDVVGILKKELGDAATRKSVIAENDQGENCWLLDSYILDYKPGSAFKRWLLPGYGETEVVVKTKLYSARTGEYLGFVEANRTVSAGGGYTIGAWKAVLSGIANDTIDEIVRQSRK